ncbi:MAG TPA: lipase maturation factor family protein [Gemmatimonadaceae bacterium]|nr:lipase maturation factor family protein [Gemmatimonadaceae bacterium]
MTSTNSLNLKKPADGYLWPRWLFLRALGLIFFSAFYSLAFQIRGLIGEQGILPADLYLQELSRMMGGIEKIWYAPTLLWINASDPALTIVVTAGIIASILLVANVAPRAMTGACTILFLSCIAALQDFSSYQSDGMLLEAGFISFFFAPGGLRPGLGAGDPPSRISLFMLRWEWFRIYFESGLVKILSGDPTWRNLTAMDDYYQNGPLPSWMGWYVQQLPHWYHAGTVIFTFFVELLLVWAMFLPRRFRIASFFVFTALQIGIIATANYAFLNYLVLCLGVLLLDDAFLERVGLPVVVNVRAGQPTTRSRVFRRTELIVLGVAFYTTVVAFILGRSASILALPNRLLAPFRIANAYGLFAVMTPARYEIEFQGSNDGRSWRAYHFRYKPQDVTERPGFYAPYQPRFDWNLWFASLGPWQQNPWVVLTEQRLIQGSPSVLSLFRDDPFNGKPPPMVRNVVYQYWFTDLATKKKTGAWWRRHQLGEFAPSVERDTTGNPIVRVPQ